MKGKLILIIFFSFMIGLAFVLKLKTNKKPKNITYSPTIQQPIQPIQQPITNKTFNSTKSNETLEVTKTVNQTNRNQIIEEKEEKKTVKEEKKVKKTKSEEDVFKKFRMKDKNEKEVGPKIDYLPPPPPLSAQTSQQVDLQVLGIMSKDNKLKVITNLGIFEEKQKITDDEIIEEIQLNRIKTNKRIILY